MDEITYLSVKFYRSDSGKEPVREWLKDLPKEERRMIGADIKTVQYGWPVGMPLVRPMQDGLFELRINLRNKIARILLCFSDNTLILLHAFIKKTKTTPNSDLKLARNRKKAIG